MKQSLNLLLLLLFIHCVRTQELPNKISVGELLETAKVDFSPLASLPVIKSSEPLPPQPPTLFGVNERRQRFRFGLRQGNNPIIAESTIDPSITTTTTSIIENTRPNSLRARFRPSLLSRRREKEELTTTTATITTTTITDLPESSSLGRSGGIRELLRRNRPSFRKTLTTTDITTFPTDTTTTTTTETITTISTVDKLESRQDLGQQHFRVPNKVRKVARRRRPRPSTSITTTTTTETTTNNFNEFSPVRLHLQPQRIVSSTFPPVSDAINGVHFVSQSVPPSEPLRTTTTPFFSQSRPTPFIPLFQDFDFASDRRPTIATTTTTTTTTTFPVITTKRFFNDRPIKPSQKRRFRPSQAFKTDSILTPETGSESEKLTEKARLEFGRGLTETLEEPIRANNPRYKVPRKFKIAKRKKSRQSGNNVHIINRYSYQEEDGSYTWGYRAEDGSFKEETRGADCITRGRYGYIDQYGELKKFEYQSGIPCQEKQETNDIASERRIGHYDYSENMFVLPDGRRVKVQVNQNNRARG